MWGHDSHDESNDGEDNSSLEEEVNRESVRKSIDKWKRTGPFTFEEVVSILVACQRISPFSIREDLDEVAHMFHPVELRQLNSAIIALAKRPLLLYRTWKRVTGDWHYSGDPQLLTDTQLAVISESPTWNRCLNNVPQMGRLEILKNAAAYNRKHVAPWTQPRDASPKPKKKIANPKAHDGKKKH